MEEIEFNLTGTTHVELIKLLKVLGLVPSGAAAKLAVEAGEVLRNGEVELRKRAKIHSGEEVTFRTYRIRVMG